MLVGYSLIFGGGVSVWSVVLRRMRIVRALRMALVGMCAVCLGLFLLNHAGNQASATRWAIGITTAVCIMVESGFTPAALSLLAGVIGSQAGRGAAMGIYSVLLSIGAIGGSLMAAALGNRFAVDGLIYATLAMAVVALALLGWVEEKKRIHAGPGL